MTSWLIHTYYHYTVGQPFIPQVLDSALGILWFIHLIPLLFHEIIICIRPGGSMFALPGISINPYYWYAVIDFTFFGNIPQPLLFIIDFTGIYSPHFHAPFYFSCKFISYFSPAVDPFIQFGEFWDILPWICWLRYFKVYHCYTESRHAWDPHAVTNVWVPQ